MNNRTKGTGGIHLGPGRNETILSHYSLLTDSSEEKNCVFDCANLNIIISVQCLNLKRSISKPFNSQGYYKNNIYNLYIKIQLYIIVFGEKVQH